MSLVLTISSAFAITTYDWNSILNDSIYYNGKQNLCGIVGFGVTLNTTGKAAWNSNTQPPYYLEEFAINVLEDLAKTTNTSQTAVVTQEHVIALVAWFWSEGGDIANSDLFNPLNSSQGEPGSSVQLTGNMAYESFNSGIQATVQTMVNSYQNRIAQALINPNTTADQVMQAITYYQNYQGNKAWAGADTANQQQYFNGLEANVAQARSNYDQEASTEMGTSKYEQYDNMHVPYSELKYGSSVSPNNPNGPIASSPCSATTTSASGYQNPLRSITNLTPGRIDQGVDYTGLGTIYALGSGTIENLTNGGWNFGGYDAFISEKLTSGPAAGDYVYVAEGCIPDPSLTIGESVTSSTPLCTMAAPSTTGIETGWATPPGNGTALAKPQFDGKDPTALGENYSQLLQSLGAPPGTMQGTTTGSLPAGWPTWGNTAL